MKDSIKTVFDNDFQGIEIFLNKVIIPIFGDDVDVLSTPEENPTNLDEEALAKASIKRLFRVASIDRIGTDPIEVFDVTIDDNTIISRSKVGIQRIIRSALFPYSHAFMVFHYENAENRNWRFSYAYKKESGANTTEAKRYTYLFGKNLHCRTAVDRFFELASSKKDNDALLNAFSVEALSDDFFDDYRAQYAKFVKYVTGTEYVKDGNKSRYVEKKTGEANEALFAEFGNDSKRVRDYIKKMLGRITFLHFLQRKRWMNGDLNYMQNLFNKSTAQDNYLDAVLEPLFFGILNTKPGDRASLFKANKWDQSLLEEWKDIPYLNGGLFEKDAEDDAVSIFPKEYFASLFDFFSEYNFTVDENDPNDAEVGVDPEMLGKIFESLLEDNKEKGAFYTPKEIVSYMCQETLISFLAAKTHYPISEVRAFVLNPDETVPNFSDDEKLTLLEAIIDIKVCDPAIGSGAFPMGMLNELVRCRMALLGEDGNIAEVKKEIISNNIYGVDIEKGAVDIARLRFWLSLVVDETVPTPLPNLDYKIMQGNSLLEKYKGVDLSSLTENKHEISLFDEEDEDLKTKLERYLKKYYNCSDHQKKYVLQENISELIKSQLKKFECRGTFGTDIIDMTSVNVSANTDFFLWHTWFGDVFKSGGFDIVIGNPPYIEHKKLKGISDKLKHYKLYSGTADFSVYFLEKGMNLLKEHGQLCFITTNKFFNTGYGEVVREYLSNKHISQLINFEQVEVFKDVLVSSVILNAFNTPKDENNSVVYEKFYKLKCEEFKREFVARRGSFGLYPQRYLTSSEWSFSDTTGLQLKEAIETDSTLLSKIEGVYIYRGVTTGYNPAFIISDEKKAELIASELCSAELIKTMLQGRNIRKWYYNEAGENLIFTRKGTDITKYHAIEDHLQQYYDELKPRTGEEGVEETGRKPGTYEWFEILDNTAYYREFEQEEKIIWGLTADKWAFTLDTQKHYLPSNAFILTSRNTSIRYLLGILNSRLMQYYFSFSGVMTAGGAYTLKGSTIGILPIKISQDTSVIENLVSQILAIKESDKNANVDSLEHELNQAVYAIYGITAAQQTVIDNTIGI